jgi:hypothetical protein
MKTTGFFAATATAAPVSDEDLGRLVCSALAAGRDGVPYPDPDLERQHQPPKAASTLPAGTTSSPSPTAMTSAFCSSGPSMTDPATPVHIC